jgi:hypothetical protein
MLARNIRRSFFNVEILIFTALIACALPTNAQQSSPREWTRITETTGQNGDEVASARSDDGILHVIWLRKNGNLRDLMHTAVDKEGKVAGAPSTVMSGWSVITNPYLVVAGGKLHAFFGGIRTTDVKDPYRQGSLYTASSSAAGTAWTLDPGAKVQSHNATASPVAATVTKDGKFVSSWAVSFALQAHIGVDPKQDDLKLETRCCTYQPHLATDSQTGEVVLEWYSNIKAASGLYAQTILPSLGTATYVPGSSSESRTDSLSADQRVGMTAREGAPGIYMGYCSGYPTCRTVQVWPYKAAAPLVVAQAPGARFVNIASGPEGRLWVMWMRSGRLYATRSNRAATRFGNIITVTPPEGTSSIWKVGGEGSNGPLDMLASVTVGLKELATWHTQVLPPLSLNATPQSFATQQGAAVVFTVSDVGDPVAEATITVAGKLLTTDAQGRATMTFPKGSKVGSISATASMKEYSNAGVKVSVTGK